MKPAAWVVLFYGIITLVGGIMGHLKSMSTASLITGGIFGILLILSSIGMFKNKLFSAYFAILLTLVLDAFFTYRFFLTYKFFPAGFMCLLSLAVLIVMLNLLNKQLKKERQP